MTHQTEGQSLLTAAGFAGMAFPLRLAGIGRDALGLENVKRHCGFSSMKLMPLLCGLLALSTPVLAQDQAGAGAGLQNAVILIIRHAEKADKGNGLSKAGQKRAKAYVGYFSNFTIGSKPLKVDYLCSTADSKESHRTRLTLEPFSKAVGLAIDDRFADTQFQNLAGAIQTKPPGKEYLICWHHGEIPQLVRALGGEPDALIGGKNWPEDVYDWVIQLRYDSDGHLLEAKRISEHLMPGDKH